MLLVADITYQMSVKVVGIIDKLGGVIKEDGFSREEVKNMLLNRSSN